MSAWNLVVSLGYQKPYKATSNEVMFKFYSLYQRSIIHDLRYKLNT